LHSWIGQGPGVVDFSEVIGEVVVNLGDLDFVGNFFCLVVGEIGLEMFAEKVTYKANTSPSKILFY